MSESGPASLEDPLYYLHNFQWVLDWVMSRYQDLLGEHEQAFAQAFARLPQASRALLVRMVMRKGQLFRSDKLQYAEIGSTEEAMAPLVTLNWLSRDPSMTLEQLFATFTWPELRSILAGTMTEWGLSGKEGKKATLAHLSGALTETRTARQWGASENLVYELEIMPLVDRFRWLFFGNPYQDWSEFVLTELGLFHYEPVIFDEHSRPVHSREELEVYWQLQDCRKALYDGLALADVAGQVPELPTDNPWLRRTRERLFYRLGREWERAGELTQARWAYTGCQYPGARGRLLRVLERLGEYPQALALAQSAEQNPETEAEIQQLSRVLPRLHRKLALAAPARAKAQEPTRLELCIDMGPRVEQAVVEQLQEDTGPVFYVENTLLTGLFGLLFWEAIFTPLTGAFFHPFQRGPADLYWPNFYERRKDLFSDGFTSLSDGTHSQRILETFRAKMGRQSPFVFWGALSEDLIEMALSCIPTEHLEKLFRRMLMDLKANRAGLPDLIQFWPEQQSYRMIEVKGPGDRLQDNQKRWLAFFAEHDIPVCVCYVTWTNGNDSEPRCEATPDNIDEASPDNIDEVTSDNSDENTIPGDDA